MQKSKSSNLKGMNAPRMFKNCNHSILLNEAAAKRTFQENLKMTEHSYRLSEEAKYLLSYTQT